MSSRWKMVAFCYVGIEAVLGAVGFSGEDAKPLVEWTVVLLLAPGVIVTLPVIYVVGAMAWSVRDAMASEPMWPVMVTFTALFVAAATVNVVLIWFTVSAISRRRRYRTLNG